MRNTIIITGASGFVGLNIQQYLKGIYDVQSISVRYIPNQELNLKADAVIHLASKAHDLKKVSNPIAYYEANFELTKQVFDAFLQSDATVFIFLSTVKAVADAVQGILTEDVVPNPKTHYGIAKQQAEQYLESQELPLGKRVYILRPCMIHGHGNKGNLNVLYQFVSKGLPWPLGDFKNERSFLSVENLCFVIKELLENSSIPSGVYQVADDQPVATNELIQLLGRSLGKKNKILNIPTSWIQVCAKLGDYIPLALNTERLQKLTENYVVSNQKIVTAIGKPLPIESKEGLLKTFDSFKK
ncbi:nucleoside-diphosphate-sugar epimerase [Flavobacterium sp. CG_9.10]|uniref:NAD-dependent epimerase/dehydratase family protein n=1 Tax=Flavobacterium sp. CG_9.10 TaxID=2787729 RepID=UPI0018C92BCA|nr:NAD-dependent epimerase/dehydratase family protein [Flavobacterium sp. CG_9.10]MBG6109855.1 nucleoside-diphosphate-sugar epimerase [Flavobacterium sp. CG_9.10]